MNEQNSHASPTLSSNLDLYMFISARWGQPASAAKRARLSGNMIDSSWNTKEGPGGSPVLFGDLLIVHCDGMDVQYVAALDKRTGRQSGKRIARPLSGRSLIFARRMRHPLCMK
ncbi:MAG: hypothetical protein R3C11_02050 [Planctomycetaceae bacterium]